MAPDVLLAEAMYKHGVLALVLLASPGCVLGRSPTARHVAMAIDGALVVGGAALMATANHSSGDTFADSFSDGIINQGQTDIGGLSLLGGLVGLVINLALAPDQSAHQPLPAAALPAVTLAPQ